jgi:hypothetical protein
MRGEFGMMPATRILGETVYHCSNYPLQRQENGLCVDKTLGIKTFMESPDPVTILTRPHYGGKTFFLSMLEAFLSHRFAGDAADRAFAGTLISEDTAFCATHRSQYVVLHFKLENALEYCSSAIPPTERALLSTEIPKKDSIQCLHHIINAYHFLYIDPGVVKKLKGIIVLIDEYDALFEKAFFDTLGGPARYAKMAMLYQKILSGLDPKLCKILLMGILKIKELIPPSLLEAPAAFYDFSAPQYHGCMEFTGPEVHQAYSLFQPRLPPYVTEARLQAEFSGYAPESRFLPHSVLRVLNQPHQTPSWEWQTGSHLINPILKQAATDNLDFFWDLAHLVRERTLPADPDQSFLSIADLLSSPMQLRYMMFHTGYLTLIQQDGALYFKIPNQQLMKACRKILTEVMYEKNLRPYWDGAPGYMPLFLSSPQQFFAAIQLMQTELKTKNAALTYDLLLILLTQHYHFRPGFPYIQTGPGFFQIDVAIPANRGNASCAYTIQCMLAPPPKRSLPALLHRRQTRQLTPGELPAALPFTAALQATQLVKDRSIMRAFLMHQNSAHPFPEIGTERSIPHYLFGLVLGISKVTLSFQQRGITLPFEYRTKELPVTVRYWSTLAAAETGEVVSARAADIPEHPSEPGQDLFRA